MNIFQQYGIREVADVCLYAIELDENDDEIYIPILYLDTLKVSTVEQSADQTSAQGGIGNPKLITWDYGKEITITLEDALFTPMEQSLTWGGNKGIKNLKLYLRNFLDKEKDLKNLNGSLRGANLIIDQFSDFLIIADRWPSYEDKIYYEKKDTGYVGGTSIYCWLVNGNIIVNSKEKVRVQDLILFYREQTQKWYFFNGKGATQNPETWYKTDKDDYDIKKYAIGYQHGKDVFNWIKTNLSGNNIEKWKKFLKNEWTDGVVDEETGSTSGVVKYSKEDEDKYRWTEYEPVSVETYKSFTDDSENTDYNIMEAEVTFLTQNLYIDGYKDNKCELGKKYSDITEEDIQLAKQGFQPYRYNASIDVEYNTNIAPPQSVIYNVNWTLGEAFYIDSINKYIASRQFCIDADINLKHGQYRFLKKYSNTELTVFINPKTMEPYIPNSYEYTRENGQKITGNLYTFKPGEVYYKWTRTKAKKGESLGKQIIIDAAHFPGTYRLVGETYIRNRLGEDQKYQFEIPLCKMGANNNLTLQAAGEPTVFSMTLTALRRNDGVMMKLTAYDGNSYNLSPEPDSKILQEISVPFEKTTTTDSIVLNQQLEIETPTNNYTYDLNENDIEDLTKQSGQSSNIEQDTYDGNIHVKLNSTIKTSVKEEKVRKDTINEEEAIGILINTESYIHTDNRYLNASEYEANLVEIGENE